MFITKKEHDEIKNRLDRIEDELFESEFSFTKGFSQRSRIKDIIDIIERFTELPKAQGWEYRHSQTIQGAWVRRNPKKK